MARGFYLPPDPSIDSTAPPIQRLVPRVPFLSLLPPPPPSISAQLSLPPSPPSLPSPIPGYRHKTHILPCAYPRTYHHSTCPPASQKPRYIWKVVDPSTESREERSKRLKSECFDLARRQDGLELVKEGERIGERMEQVVERFVKEEMGECRGVGGKKEVTLIFGNANGLPVEDWEFPLRTVTSLIASGSFPFEVVEIWFLNTPLVDPNHGTAYSWSDHARDLTSFILHYLPVAPTSSDLPQMLFRRDEPAQRDGIVNVGHSFSGTAFLLAELEKGRDGGEALGEGLLLLDPMILDPRSEYAQKNVSTPQKPSTVVMGSVGRADVWPSFSAVKPALLRSPFFQRFDPTQLDSYLRHGFCLINPSDPSDERVTLTFPRWAEGLIFGRGDTIKETWDRLEFGEKVGKGCKEVRFVFPELFGMTGTSSDSRRLAHFLSSPPTPTNPTPTRVSNVIVERAAHLIVQERPDAVAEVLLEFLVDLFGGEPLLAKL
ncbi:hypothetical protein BDY24DRAFT_233333 [Mrakia frigida]|uniref:uncharacterized protein n=1 Tax=Mrakia frigida TaxID=29902 RepID=UPI003FCC1248